MNGSEQLLDIEQAARFLNVSETSLRRWTNSGRLACLRVGMRRERRFRVADLLAFLERQPAVGSGTAPASFGGHTEIDGLTVSHGMHFCGLYSTEAGRVKQAAAFLGRGSLQGTVSFLVGGAEDRAAILAALTRDRPGTEADIEAGRLVSAAYAADAEAQLRWWEAELLAATQAGATSLRAIGDARGFPEGATQEELTEYEAGYDQRVAKRFPVVTLCQYDVRRFSGLAVLDVLKAHRDSFQYPPERVLA
jgi:excisionase family DNA binding protein